MRVLWLKLFKINLLPPARFFFNSLRFFLTFFPFPARFLICFLKLHKYGTELHAPDPIMMMMMMMIVMA